MCDGGIDYLLGVVVMAWGGLCIGGWSVCRGVEGEGWGEGL